MGLRKNIIKMQVRGPFTKCIQEMLKETHFQLSLSIVNPVPQTSSTQLLPLRSFINHPVEAVDYRKQKVE